MEPPESREIPLRDGMIRLGQLLKLADLADDGAAAKALLAEGRVSVNGDPEGRRGRQVRTGDIVTLTGPDGITVSQVTVV